MKNLINGPNGSKWYPRGIMIVLIGTDGSGKTTIKRFLEEALILFYPSVCHFYFRPELFPPLGVLLGLREDVRTEVNLDPHGHKKENPLKSFLRFFYYLLDFTVGYWLKVHPLLRRGYLIIFDRYYYDYFVDLFRFNMSLPSWLPKIFLPLVPKPNLTVYLHGSAENLYKRKQEIPLSEISRQIVAYEALVSRLHGAIKVSTEKPISEVVFEIVNYLRAI